MRFNLSNLVNWASLVLLLGVKADNTTANVANHIITANTKQNIAALETESEKLNAELTKKGTSTGNDANNMIDNAANLVAELIIKNFPTFTKEKNQDNLKKMLKEDEKFRQELSSNIGNTKHILTSIDTGIEDLLKQIIDKDSKFAKKQEVTAILTSSDLFPKSADFFKKTIDNGKLKEIKITDADHANIIEDLNKLITEVAQKEGGFKDLKDGAGFAETATYAFYGLSVLLTGSAVYLLYLIFSNMKQPALGENDTEENDGNENTEKAEDNE